MAFLRTHFFTSTTRFSCWQSLMDFWTLNFQGHARTYLKNNKRNKLYVIVQVHSFVYFTIPSKVSLESRKKCGMCAKTKAEPDVRAMTHFVSLIDWFEIVAATILRCCFPSCVFVMFFSSTLIYCFFEAEHLHSRSIAMLNVLWSRRKKTLHLFSFNLTQYLYKCGDYSNLYTFYRKIYESMRN
jgi:hypothetical protein